MNFENIEKELKSLFGEDIREIFVNFDNLTVVIKKEKTYDIVKFLKENFEFNFLMDLFGIDFLNYPSRKYKERFEVVYNLYSLKNNLRIIIKAPVDENNPFINSIVSLYDSANWYEREVYDMYGIVFENHPDLRRILMYDEFVGYPLRKDYPLKKRQPRISYREIDNGNN
ncbi:MAG: NADH-quinone oxidoreductase subunit C [Elusimicrobiota bacterium]